MSSLATDIGLCGIFFFFFFFFFFFWFWFWFWKIVGKLPEWDIMPTW